MQFEKATALVVRGSDWSETSKIATLFTREHGKIRALAKGGRRVKSSFDIAFDLLTVCDVAFIKSRSGGLDLLTEARMLERFGILRQNLPALYVGYYIAELLGDGIHDYDPHPPLFDAALHTLRNLGKGGNVVPLTKADYWQAVSSFELVWLRELGYSPRLRDCAACGMFVADVGAGVEYSPSSGGILCSACSPESWDHRHLSHAGWEALIRFDTATAHPEIFSGNYAVALEVRSLLGQVVSFVLGRRPRLLGYIDGG